MHVPHTRSVGKRIKRGRGARAVTLDEAAIVSPDSAVDLIVIDDLLNQFERFDARKSRAPSSPTSAD